MGQNLPSARAQAVLILHKVVSEGAYANLQTAQALAGYSEPDRRLVTELVNGVLRRRSALDWQLDQLLKKTVADLPLKIALVLEISVYQLLYLDKIPPSAVVNEAVKLARKFGHQGTASLTNGVLRNYLRRREELTLPTAADGTRLYLTVTLSHPEWLADYLIERFGEADAITFAEYNEQAHPVVLRTNDRRVSREQLCTRLREAGFACQPTAYAPLGVAVERSAGLFAGPLFAEGLFQVQDQSSMLVADALAPQPGARVLDLCAAPGGKTCHLAQLMEDRGELKAFDLHEHKVKLIEENYRRLGLTCIEAQTADARKLAGQYKEWADYLLLDAPCSGLGILGRKADLRWRKRPEDVGELSALSFQLLISAADLVRPGGVLVYSTCTVTAAENEDNIARFLAQRPDFSREGFAGLWPANLPPVILQQAERGQVQLLPQNCVLEGFFICRLRKKGRDE